jgi:hypothetical protein
LLVNELTALVHDIIRVQRALLSAFALSPFPATCSWKGNTGEATRYGQNFLMLAISASYSERGGFGGEG